MSHSIGREPMAILATTEWLSRGRSPLKKSLRRKGAGEATVELRD